MYKLNIAKTMLVATALSFTALAAQAAEYKGIVGIGLDFGGDVLKSGLYTNGSTWEVKANQGLTFNGGMVMVNGVHETQATIGYKFGGPQAKNGSVTWDTIPVELIQFYRTGIVRAGLGFVYQINPKLVVDIPGTSQTINYDNSLGLVAQVGWAPADMPISIDLRLTAIKYKEKNVSGAKDISGGALGIYSSYYF